MAILIAAPPQKVSTLVFKKLVLKYNSNNGVIDLRHGGVQIRDKIFLPLQKSTFGLNFSLDPQISQVCQEIFELSGYVQSTMKNFSLSAEIANQAFGWFKNATVGLSAAGAQVASAIVWLKICEEAWKWESANGMKLHKGTPYYFLAEEYLTAGNLDAGYLFVHNAVEEDKRLATQTGTPQSYKGCPAYMFASLVVNKNNCLYYLVDEMKKTIDNLISSFIPVFGPFTFSDLENKLLKNDRLEETKFIFIYNLSNLIQQRKLSASNLTDNDFCRLRNLDVLVNFGIITDKVLQERYRGRMMNDNVVAFSAAKGWLTDPQLATFKGSIGFNDDPDIIIPKLLPLTNTFNGNPVPKELLCMLIALKLRNYGSHNIACQSICTTNYDDLIEMVIHALFIAVKELP